MYRTPSEISWNRPFDPSGSNMWITCTPGETSSRSTSPRLFEIILSGRQKLRRGSAGLTPASWHRSNQVSGVDRCEGKIDLRSHALRNCQAVACFQRWEPPCQAQILTALCRHAHARFRDGTLSRLAWLWRRELLCRYQCVDIIALKLSVQMDSHVLPRVSSGFCHSERAIHPGKLPKECDRCLHLHLFQTWW